jgi:putative ABC transport system substrate-binding protein
MTMIAYAFLQHRRLAKVRREKKNQCSWGIESDPDARARVKAFRQRLGELGWSEDRNVRIDVVWGAGDADHVRADAADLIRASPDVIVTNGPVPTTEVAQVTSAKLGLLA